MSPALWPAHRSSHAACSSLDMKSLTLEENAAITIVEQVCVSGESLITRAAVRVSSTLYYEAKVNLT